MADTNTFTESATVSHKGTKLNMPPGSGTLENLPSDTEIENEAIRAATVKVEAAAQDWIAKLPSEPGFKWCQVEVTDVSVSKPVTYGPVNQPGPGKPLIFMKLCTAVVTVVAAVKWIAKLKISQLEPQPVILPREFEKPMELVPKH